MALEFDGVSERVEYPSIHVPNGNPFSFACRFNLFSVSGNEYILLVESGATDFGFTVWLRDEAGQQGFAVTCSGANGSVLRYSVPQALSINHWYDLIVTWNGTTSASGVHIYLDETELSYAGSTDGVAPLRAQDGNWIVGGRATDNLRNLSGRLADLGAWSKILSVGERTDFFSGLPPAYVQPIDLVFDARFVAGDTEDVVTSNIGTSVGTPIGYSHPTNVLDNRALMQIPRQALVSVNGSAVSNNSSGTISSSSILFAQSASSSNILGPSFELTIFDQYEGGNVDTGRVIIENIDTLDPTITLYARPNVNVEGALPASIYYSLACRITGVQGKTPKIKLNLVDAAPNSLYGSAGWPLSWRPWFSYDNATWQRMDNSSVVGNFQEVSHSTAFLQNTIYFATRPPYNPSRGRAHTDSIGSNSFVSEPPSSAGKNFAYGQSAATTRDGDALAVPALDLISYRVTDDTKHPLDGSRKRVAVLIAGQHASEDQGNWQLQAFVDYLLGGAAVANALLRNWEFFVYPMINPSGRWGNAYRGTLQTNERDEDPNRDWPGGVTSGRLHVITETRLAIEKDTKNSINAFIDFHGRFRASDSIFRFPNPTNDGFISFVNARHAVASVESTTVGGVSETYYRSAFNVALSVTSEGSGFVTSIFEYSLLGEALAEGLNDSFEAGLFPVRSTSTRAVVPLLSQAISVETLLTSHQRSFVSEVWW